MGLFSGALNFVGRGLNGALGTTSAMKQQNQQQWDMWNAQNAYNTPAAQMERLKAAGLNPMLVYGSGSHSFSAGTMSASGASGAGGGVLGSLISSGLSRLSNREKNELAQQNIDLEKKRVRFAGERLHQDLQLGQEQIAQVRANASLALLQAEKQSIENGILMNLQKSSFGWQNPKSSDTVNTVLRGLHVLANPDPSTWGVSVPDVYDKSLPALGRNVKR